MYGFKKYGVSIIQDCLPHQIGELDVDNLKEKVKAARALFARFPSWISSPSIAMGGGKIADNQGIKTEWWFCIKDSPIDIKTLSAKQRYRVNKGLKLNRIRIITEADEKLINALVDLKIASFEDYPKVYRPKIDRKKATDEFKRIIVAENTDLWLCSDAEDNLTGYAICHLHPEMANLSVVKTDPKYLKTEINAALAYSIVHYYINELGLKYICDGERNIRHQTNYQEFLVRVLDFRYVYCRLNVVYHPYFKPVIKLLYTLRWAIGPLRNINGTLYNLHCLLLQEKIARSFK